MSIFDDSDDSGISDLLARRRHQRAGSVPAPGQASSSARAVTPAEVGLDQREDDDHDEPDEEVASEADSVEEAYREQVRSESRESTVPSVVELDEVGETETSSDEPAERNDDVENDVGVDGLLEALGDSPVTKVRLAVSQHTREPAQVDHGRVSDVKNVPKAVIERMRDMLAAVPEYGRERADRVSIANVINGYLLSQLNISREGYGEEVVAVAQAFSYHDPTLGRMEALVRQLEQQNAVLARMYRHSMEQETRLRSVELGMSYLLAERTGQLDTSNVLPETMEMVQKKVLAARHRTREQAEFLHKQEERSKGSSRYFRG